MSITARVSINLRLLDVTQITLPYLAWNARLRMKYYENNSPCSYWPGNLQAFHDKPLVSTLKKKVSNSKHWNYTCKTVFSNPRIVFLASVPSGGSSICANVPVHSPVRLSGGGGRCHPCSPAPEHCRLWGRSEEEWVCGDTLRVQVCGTVAPGLPRRSWTISASDLENILFQHFEIFKSIKYSSLRIPLKDMVMGRKIMSMLDE